jgi:hypothetical protein
MVTYPMGLGRRRARTELLDAVRLELEAARTEMQDRVALSVARLESRLHDRLDERDRRAAEVAAELAGMGDELGARVAEFERTLARVAESCDLAVHTVQANRVERLRLLDAIEQLTALLPGDGPPLPARRVPKEVLDGAADGGGPLRVVGGSVDGGQQSADIPAAHPAGSSRQVIRLDGVEVRCRFGHDHWVSGFEVADVVDDGDGIHYRLRRRADGYELPRLFPADDVRDVDTPHLRRVPRR